MEATRLQTPHPAQLPSQAAHSARLTISDALDAKLPEVHDVARQCASLVLRVTANGTFCKAANFSQPRLQNQRDKLKRTESSSYLFQNQLKTVSCAKFRRQMRCKSKTQERFAETRESRPKSDTSTEGFDLLVLGPKTIGIPVSMIGKILVLMWSSGPLSIGGLGFQGVGTAYLSASCGCTGLFASDFAALDRKWLC